MSLVHQVGAAHTYSGTEKNDFRFFRFTIGIIKQPHIQVVARCCDLWYIRKGTDLIESQLRSIEKCTSAFIKSYVTCKLSF